jgi:hypothetical protein
MAARLRSFGSSGSVVVVVEPARVVVVVAWAGSVDVVGSG